MKIFVIGGTKFIGLAAVEALAKRGHDIFLFHRGHSKPSLPDNCVEIFGDRNDIKTLEEALKSTNADIIIDAYCMVQKHAEDLKTIIPKETKHLVVLSSMDVYKAFGILSKKEADKELVDIPFDEQSPLRTNLYPYRGMSDDFEWYDKILVEKEYMDIDSCNVTICRLPFVYGPEDYQHRLHPYVQRILDGRKAILIEKSFALWRSSRGYVHNVAHGIALAAENTSPGKRIYNIADSDPLSEEDWIDAIAEQMDWDGDIVVVSDEMMPSELKLPLNYKQEFVADTSKIREELNYKEPYNTEEALMYSIAWEKENGPEDTQEFNYDIEDFILERLR